MPTAPADASASEVLFALRGIEREVLEVELRKAELVLAWAAAHHGDTLLADPPVPGGERAVELAGPGAPTVAEFAIADLAVVLHLSTESARGLLADLLELRHRLPGCWARVQSLQVPLWRARRVAVRTRDLPAGGAADVDRRLARHVHSLGPTALHRAVEAARAAWDPEAAAQRAAEARESRRALVSFGQPGLQDLTGLGWVDAALDLPDALDLDRALAAGAEALAAAGSTAPLDVRRAQALGELARGGAISPGPTAAPRPTSREVVLHVHLPAGAIADDAVTTLAHLETGPQRLQLADTIRAWCGAPATTRITVRPVVDLSDDLEADGYEVPDRIRDQVVARDETCTFPWCSRPARSGDIDHVVAHEAGGPTASHNLSPLCRYHHRVKTHGRWRYRRIDYGTYEWRSPAGAWRTTKGRTLEVARPDPPGSPPPPF